MPPEIVIVSGLPRSGTSLMMQMLERGGVPGVTDGERIADEDNPRGYFELEAVKRLKADAAWLADARGKAVKAVSQHLFDLPATEQYRILLMRRDLDEVLTSQEKMLIRSGRKGAPRETMKAAFKSHLAKLDAWLAAQPHMQVLPVDYAAVVADPRAAAERINEFLGGRLDVEAMVEAVDPALYRNRAN